MVCLRNISVDILHKEDTEDDDDYYYYYYYDNNDDSNNNYHVHAPVRTLACYRSYSQM